MGIERAGFQIDITADVSGLTKGTKEASSNLQDVTGKAKGLNESLEDGKSKLDQHGKGLEEAGEHAKLFGEHEHEVHAGVKALGDIIPGVTGLAREMFSVTTLGIGIAGLGLSALVEHFQKMAEEEEAFNTSAAQGVGDMLKAQGDKAAEAATAHQTLADALEHAATGESSFVRSMENRLKVFDAYIKGLEAVEKAEDAAEEAAIRRAERNKDITPEQAQAKLDALHGKAEARTTAHTDQEAQQRVTDEAALLAQAQRDQAALAAKVEAAEAAVRDIQARAKSDSKAGEQAGTALYGEGKDFHSPSPDSAQGKVDTAVREYDKQRELQTNADLRRAESMTQRDADIFTAQAKAAMDESVRVRDQQAGLVKQAQEERERHAAELKTAQDEAAEANRKLGEANKIISEYGGPEGKVAQDAAALQAQRGVNKAVSDVQSGAALLQKGNDILAGSRGDAAGSPQGKSDASYFLQFIGTLTDFLSTHPALNGQMQADFKTELAEFKRELAFLKSQANVGRTL